MASLPSYQQLADGLLLPAGLANHPALDFCNTLAGRGGNECEYLADYHHLAVWAREARLLNAVDCRAVRRLARADPQAAEATLEQAKTLRERLYRLCVRTARPDDRDAVGSWIEAAAAAARLILADAEPASAASWRLPRQLGLALPLHAVARSAGDLLLAYPVAHIGRCSRDGCGWLFLDPAGRRRWCSMKTCGNREKARRHAARHR